MRRWSSISALHIIAAIIVFACPALWEFLRGSALSTLNSADFWWHLQTGLQILRTHALPHTGWFSQSASQPWIASSWLYDVAVAVGFRWLGLRFLPLLAVMAKLALAVAVFVLAGGTRGRFWPALALSAIAQYLLFAMPPLPVFCSVLALAIELVLLLELRQGHTPGLYFIPILFLVWANIDFHFVYGIAVLAIFVSAEVVTLGQKEQVPRFARDDSSKRVLLACTAASLIATFVTPYGWGSYGIFWSNITSAANAYFPDYLSLRFRTPQDYVLLLLAMTAFLALGLRRSRDAFQIALLVLCIMAAFHAQRDGWLLVLASVAVIANPLPEEAASSELRAASFEQRSTFYVAAGFSFILLVAFVAARMPSNDALRAKIAEHYPIAASDYIRGNHLPTPLFNPYPWGGFLTWYLPEYPVAIDGRAELYGPDFNVEYAKVMNFQAHYSTFAPLNAAGTILLDKSSNMAAALPSARGFKTVYSDNVAVVLVRDQGQP